MLLNSMSNKISAIYKWQSLVITDHWLIVAYPELFLACMWRGRDRVARDKFYLGQVYI